MEKEFNLSKTEIKINKDCLGVYRKDDVKEFIRLLKEATIKITDHDEGMMFMEEIDKLAGEELTGGSPK